MVKSLLADSTMHRLCPIALRCGGKKIQYRMPAAASLEDYSK